MTYNLSPANRDYALFLPSVSSVYVKYCSDYYSIQNTPRAGIHPEGIPSFDDLNFVSGTGLYHYDHVLYSAGHAFYNNLELSWKNERMIQQRDRKKTWVMGDSGGFQIGKGIIEFDWKDFEGNAANKVRRQILDWLEATSDYAMILDIPAWAIGKQPGIDSFKSCLEGTLFNNDFFMKNRKGETKFLNVLQGRSKTEADIWYDAVKDLPFEGWSFGGDNMRDFEMILNRVIEMRDGHYFEENSNGEKRDWLHFLGQSRLLVSCALTTIQRILRKQLSNDNLSVSYDSASAFISTAHGQVFTTDVFNNKKFSYLMQKMYDDRALVGSDLPFPWRSTVGDRLTLGDICVKDKHWRNRGGGIPKTSWDSYSYVLLMGHNVERHIRAIQQANRIYDLAPGIGAMYMPSKLIAFKEIMEDIFASEKPYDLIRKYHKELNNFTGLKTGKGTGIAEEDRATSVLFNWDKPRAGADDVDYENQEALDEVEQEAA